MSLGLWSRTQAQGWHDVNTAQAPSADRGRRRQARGLPRQGRAQGQDWPPVRLCAESSEATWSQTVCPRQELGSRASRLGVWRGSAVLGGSARLGTGRAPVQDWLTRSLSFCSGQESAEEAGRSEGEFCCWLGARCGARLQLAGLFPSRTQAAVSHTVAHGDEHLCPRSCYGNGASNSSLFPHFQLSW